MAIRVARTTSKTKDQRIHISRDLNPTGISLPFESNKATPSPIERVL